ncbi:unnamed protein product [Prorocentrum cordatum]|uniref:Transmembrane protein n=1 Tax=Prorocentrum cordatum TaxID=2364126 RepID=A0ABN9RB01_9DINO|nr:unnamed protein product [Polarella glacialis]
MRLAFFVRTQPGVPPPSSPIPPPAFLFSSPHSFVPSSSSWLSAPGFAQGAKLLLLLLFLLFLLLFSSAFLVQKVLGLSAAIFREAMLPRAIGSTSLHDFLSADAMAHAAPWSFGARLREEPLMLVLQARWRSMGIEFGTSAAEGVNINACTTSKATHGEEQYDASPS